MRRTQPIPIALLAALLPFAARAFVVPTPQRCLSSARTTTTTATSLGAKKNKKKKRKRTPTSGEGFAKSPSPASPSVAVEEAAVGEEPRALRSIELPSSPPGEPELDLDPSLAPEERSQAILRQKFGLRSYEEQRADAGDARALIEAEGKARTREKLRNIEKLWPEDRDLLSVLPPGLIKGVDTFLKLGLGLSTAAFLAAGVLITVEAGSKATGSELPGGLEQFVVNVVEPGFTPGLGVLLGFSITLGLFSVALGGSAGSSYREGP